MGRFSGTFLQRGFTTKKRTKAWSVVTLMSETLAMAQTRRTNSCRHCNAKKREFATRFSVELTYPSLSPSDCTMSWSKDTGTSHFAFFSASIIRFASSNPTCRRTAWKSSFEITKICGVSISMQKESVYIQIPQVTRNIL